MAEREPYPSELDLRAAFRTYLEDAPTQVRPTELARQFATDYPHRRTALGPWHLPAVPRLAWATLMVAALLAAVAGAAFVGSRLLHSTPDPLTLSGIEALPEGPGPFQSVAAISHDELWVTNHSVVWHFRDGDWTNEVVDSRRWHDLTLAPDGTLWATGAEGTAYRRDGRWVVVDTHGVSAGPRPASSIAVGQDGTVWVVGGDRPDCTVRRLQSSGDSWSSTVIAKCPSGGAWTSVAVDGRGDVWFGAQGFVHNALARYADGRWETTEARTGLPDDASVEVLGISATGEVWIRFQVVGKYAARYDGTRWTVTPEVPDRLTSVAPDPEGAPALARYDWTSREGLSPDIELPLTPLAAAPDGTVFALDADGRFVRVPAPSP